MASAWVLLFFSCFTLAVSFFFSRSIGEKVCIRDVHGSHTQYLLLSGCCCSWWWRHEILVKPFSLFFVSASKKQRGWCGVEVCSEAKKLDYWSRLPLTLGKPPLWAISEAPSNPPRCILSSPICSTKADHLLISKCWSWAEFFGEGVFIHGSPGMSQQLSFHLSLGRGTLLSRFGAALTSSPLSRIVLGEQKGYPLVDPAL